MQTLKNSFVERLKAQTEQDPNLENKYFGFERQENNRAYMFELRTRDGKRTALPYSYMTRTDFDPDKGIEIFVSNVVVTVTGRNLEDIYTYLLQNRLTWLREDASGVDIGEEGCFVEGVEVSNRGDSSSFHPE